MNDRQKPINYLKQYIGVKEGSEQHKAILKVFNDSKLCKRYTMTTKDAWCATSVSAAFIASGLKNIFPCVECSCNEMINKAKTAGIWQERDDYKPTYGDVVLYDWQDNGKGDNTGFPDHVGIVSAVNGNGFRVIEGNYKDSVGYRDMQINGKYIRGFIVPKYKEETKTETKPETTTKPTAEKTTAGDLNQSEKWVGIVTASALNVRKWAGKEWAKCSFGPLPKGTKVSVCDSIKAKNGAKWYYIKYKGKYGFVSSEYIKKS